MIFIDLMMRLGGGGGREVFFVTSAGRCVVLLATWPLEEAFIAGIIIRHRLRLENVEEGSFLTLLWVSRSLFCRCVVNCCARHYFVELIVAMQGLHNVRLL